MPSQARLHRQQVWSNNFGLFDIDWRNRRADEGDLTYAFYCLLDDSELQEVFAEFMVGQVDGQDRQQDHGDEGQSALETRKAS